MYNKQLEALVCVADCGSFGRAAEQLYISPTAVMKQINALEKHLGLALLVRSHQGVRLTPAGESIYKDARYLFEYSQKAVERARGRMEAVETTFCVGTSMLNPCKAFMDLWYRISDGFPGYKLHIVPFEDDHNGILSEISSLGEKYDFLVGVCDSARWLSRCSFYPLGEYTRCVAVPLTHRLAAQKAVRLTDLHGETLVMVGRGDSPINDGERDEIEQNHPQIRLESTAHFYDIEVFNHCAKTGHLLSSIECWQDIHPSLVTIPMEPRRTIPYGLLYQKDPPEDIRRVIAAIEALRQAG